MYKFMQSRKTWNWHFEGKSSTVQYRKWSPTANDPETPNDPQNGPQMILDRKWSPKMTANDPVKIWGMEWILWDWLQKRTDYKYNIFKSEKDMVSTVYFFFCQLLQFSFKNCCVAENLRQAGGYAEKTRYLNAQAQLAYWGIQSRASSTLQELYWLYWFF